MRQGRHYECSKRLISLRLNCVLASADRSGVPQPYGGIMEACTTVRRYGVIADQRVDSPLLLEGIGRPDALDDHRGSLLSRIRCCHEQDRAAMIANAHSATLAH